jgi:hypothetical protein
MLTRRLLSLASALFLAATVTLPARTADAKVEVSTFTMRDKSLNAEFASTSDGCFFAFTTLHFTSQVTQTGGPPMPAPPVLTVDVSYTTCSGEFFDLTGGTSTPIVNIAPDLSSATLQAVVPVTDGVVNANVTINARFTANGDLQRFKDTNVSRADDSITIERVDVQARSADMTGSSISTVLPLEAGPTFVDLSSEPVSGQMGKDLFGTRTITFTRGRHGNGHWHGRGHH